MEAFEGLSHLSNSSYSIPTQRCLSLLDARRQPSTSSERAYMFLQLLRL